MNNTLPKYEKYKDSGVEWLGEIPEHWDRKRIKFELKYQKGKNPKEITLEETLDIYLSMEFLRSNSKKIQYVKNKKDLIEVNSGDILLLWDGSNAGEFIKGKKGILSSTMAMIKLNSINKQFAWHYLNIVERQLRETTVGMGIPHVSGEELNNLMMLIPPITEQTLISQYLDRKTALIDQAIGIKEKQIELLKERRQILIHKAVTRGLNPDVKMKDSGVEWIGEVPEGWEVKRLKNTTKIFRGKFTHRPRNDERLYDGQYPFFQTGDVAKAGKYLSEYKQTLNDFGLRVSTLFPKGTIVITIAANIGDISILDIDACFPDSIVGFKPMDFIKRDFLYNSLLVMKEQFVSSTIKNTQMNLNVDRIGTNSITIPPILEQNQILEHIEIASQKVETTITLKQQEIEKLKEYKATLINSAVTGKIKVS